MEKAKLKTIRLYSMADNELYIKLCIAIYNSKAPITLLGALNSSDVSDLKGVFTHLVPDVVLMSLKDLGGDTIKELEHLRLDHPNLGVVILLESCNAQDAERLRRLALQKGAGGTAILLKQQVDRVELLVTAITAVRQGQLIFDASLTSLMFVGKPGHAFLKQFSLKELKILNLLANGYTNEAIAAALYIDIKTVKQHINDMYDKLEIDHGLSDKHLRVHVAKLYLEAIGDLPKEECLSGPNPINQV